LGFGKQGRPRVERDLKTGPAGSAGLSWVLAPLVLTSICSSKTPTSIAARLAPRGAWLEHDVPLAPRATWRVSLRAEHGEQLSRPPPSTLRE